MRFRSGLTAVGLSVVLSTTLLAQPTVDEPSDPEHELLMEVLSTDCGAGREEDSFRRAIEEMGLGIVPDLLLVLESGPPDEVLEEVRAWATVQYERRQAWLQEHGRELFAEDAERLLQRTLQEYLDDVVRQTDLRYRENAIRALGIVGGRDVLDALAAAVEKEPQLLQLADSATRSIESRTNE